MLQDVWHEAVRKVPSSHLILGAGDARPGSGVPRALLHLLGVPGAADQGRPVRHARPQCLLPAPLRGGAARVVAGAAPAGAVRPPAAAASEPLPLPPAAVPVARRRLLAQHAPVVTPAAPEQLLALRPRAQVVLQRRPRLLVARPHHPQTKGQAPQAEAQGSRRPDCKSR